MKKRDELTHPDSCMARASDDEPVFVLLGRDAAATGTIRRWTQLRLELGRNRPDDAQIASALETAEAMERYRSSTAAPAVSVVGPHCAAPAWFDRATAGAGLSSEQRDTLLHAMVREFPVDPLLIAVVESVDDAIAQTDGQEASDTLAYGGLVAPDVVMGIGRALFGEVVKLPRVIAPRRTFRIPADAVLVLGRDLDAERVHIEPGGQLVYGEHAFPSDILRTDEGHRIHVDREKGVAQTIPTSTATA